MISVVIPLYNKQNHIRRTVDSVLNQSYPDFEIIVVNDGSTDDSAGIVESIADSRIRLVNQTNSGVSVTRNRGIAEAKGDFVALLDADDNWKPQYLETQMALVAKYPEADIFVTGYECTDQFGKISSTTVRNLPFNNADGILSNYFRVASTSNPPICSINIMARKGCFEAIGGFPLNVTSGEDLLTWAKIACKYKIAYNQSPLAIYYTPTTGPTGKVPVDLTSTKDAVGLELIKLHNQYPQAGIKEYIGFWYKMRAVINLKRGNKIAALKCAGKSIRYFPASPKPWIIAILSLCPNRIVSHLMK